MATAGTAWPALGVSAWRHDADTGLLHCDAAGWALLGLAPEAAGRPLAGLLARAHPQDLASAAAALAAQAAGQVIDIALRCCHADGQWRLLLCRGQARFDQDGRLLGHTGLALDLSRHAGDLQRAQRLELATAAAGVGIWSAPEGLSQAPTWDDHVRRLHGWPDQPPPDSLSDYLQRCVHPDDRPLVDHSLQALTSAGRGQADLEYRILWPDGSVCRLATRTALAGEGQQALLYGVIMDITDRTQAEDRLREAHARSALATRGAGIGTWESDATANAGWWDEQMFLLRGLPPQPGLVQLSDMLQWLHPDDLPRFQQQLRAALDQDGPTNYEFRVVRPDGQVRWLASRSVPVPDAQGRTVRRIGINWDITDARNAAQAREERQLALRESQAKSRLLARISHELRTPLNAVLGFSQLLLADGPDPATWRQRVGHVHTAGQHLLSLIDDVLELSSLDSGELPQRLQAVALQALVAECLPQVELLAQAQGVQVQAAPTDAWVLADAARLRQALLNLLSNAIHYNHPGGQVRLEVRAAGDLWSVRVQDTGRGLDAGQLAQLFEPFSRLEREPRAHQGVGLGLAIARASLRQMGGELRVSSQPGEGSCFELLLRRADPPAAPAPTPAAELAAAGRLPALPGTGSLLYIEDNEVNLMIVEALLGQRPDLQLLSAHDGRSGLALARQARPSLVLLDMQLPDIDGLEVLQRLRADPATAAIPCIALSANAMPEDIQAALAAGFDAYWTKPLDLEAFQQALDRLFGPAPH